MLETGLVDLLRRAGAGARMDREGIVHNGCWLSNEGQMFRVDFDKACGRQVMVYGQTEATRDLYEAQNVVGATILRDVADVKLHNLTSDAPSAAWSVMGPTARRALLKKAADKMGVSPPGPTLVSDHRVFDAPIFSIVGAGLGGKGGCG